MTQALRANCIRVLVVEDNRDICENIGDYLGARGHITDFAHDGISAMHLALTESIDVIVLDLMLPGMDGLTFCRKVRLEAKRDMTLAPTTTWKPFATRAATSHGKYLSKLPRTAHSHSRDGRVQEGHPEP